MTMIFEPDNAFLRYIRVGDQLVLLGINAPIRNELWGTVPPQVSNVHHSKSDDGFTLTFDALCKERDIDFLWKGEVTGNARGEIVFTFDGEARSTFKRNRIGFCVLHPANAAGQPWVIENIHGNRVEGTFPEFISPHQPAKEIRAISHLVAPNLWAHVKMEGDTFEMEDQRNWTDASFKTYCTPLEIPYPVEIAQGTKISQTISIRLDGDLKPYQNGPSEGSAITLTLGEKRTPLPRLGLMVSSEMDTLSDTEINRLRALDLDHLRIDLTPSEPGFTQRLQAAATQTKTLDVGLHLGLRLGDDAAKDLKRIAKALETLQPRATACLLIGADDALYHKAKEALSPMLPNARFGAPREGISFTELNRERPSKDIEIIAYHMTPQIHASDNASIIESLPIQGDTVRSARQFIGSRPLYISPITFHTLLPGADPLPGDLPWNVDARQPSKFAAAWTVGSFKFLAEAGVEGVTYYETVGWRGIMDTATPPERPDKFPTKPGALYPIYDVFEEIAPFKGGHVQAFESSNELAVVGLALVKADQVAYLIANLTEAIQSVRVRGPGSRSIDLQPHAISHIRQ